MRIVLPKTVVTCWWCRGWGAISWETCKICGGSQFVYRDAEIYGANAKAPRGVGKSVVAQIATTTGLQEYWAFGPRLSAPHRDPETERQRLCAGRDRDDQDAFPPWAEQSDEKVQS